MKLFKPFAVSIYWMMKDTYAAPEQVPLKIPTRLSIMHVLRYCEHLRGESKFNFRAPEIARVFVPLKCLVLIFVYSTK